VAEPVRNRLRYYPCNIPRLW